MSKAPKSPSPLQNKNLKPEILVICDNIRSRENVGAIFRTANGAGVAKIYLCGITPCPPHPKISKTALGAENYIPWQKINQTWRLIEKLKNQGVFIVALEQTPQAKNIFKAKIKYPLALVIGNEIKGLSKKILNRADLILQIPMRGKKESLNVAVAFGIAVYQLLPKS